MNRRIGIDLLRPGMFIDSFELSWFKHPFLSTRLGVVRDATLVAQLRTLGVRWVVIDEARGEPLEPPTAPPEIEAVRHRPAPPPPMEEPPHTRARAPARAAPLMDPPGEIPPPDDPERSARFARRLFRQAMGAARRLLGDVAHGQKVDVPGLRALIGQMVESVRRNEGILHAMVMLKSFDEYTFTHSVNLAALGVLLGDALDAGESELETIGMAGILHDVGKCLLPKRILQKPGRLTPAEFEQIKRHPELAVEHLRRQQDVPPLVLRAVMEHHERLDGGGYPRGLTGDRIHPYSSMISIVDVYDAITSDRPYHERVSPYTALRTLYSMRGAAFPSGMVDTFIKRLGVYPVHSVVRLRNGYYAVVTGLSREHPLYPEVTVFCDPQRRPVTRRRLETWTLCQQLARREFEIERVVEPKELPPPSLPA